MSGFVRPSSVGPRELKASSALPAEQTAPTVNALGDAAGSAMLPAATACSNGPTPLPTMTSMRGVRVAARRQTAMPNKAVRSLARGLDRRFRPGLRSRPLSAGDDPAGRVDEIEVEVLVGYRPVVPAQ